MEYEGILNFLKPAGISSHDAVSAVKRIMKANKAGHTGTLDPMAVGVLPICFGKATRIIEYLPDNKKYRCELILGITSDTQDIWGEIHENNFDFNIIKDDKIIEVVESFKGIIHQEIPAYSAVKQDGKKLYDYARKGQDVPIKKKEITVFDIKTLSINRNKNTVMFDIHCSKGSYVRTICHEIGQKLGCGAAMSFLLRTKSGNYNIEDSVTFQEIADYPSSKEFGRIIKPADSGITDIKSLELPVDRARAFINGLSTKLKTNNKPGDVVKIYGVLDEEGEKEFLGIGKFTEDSLRPHKVIKTGNR